jgi:glycosyltransferase involved in cell wall biosynthesis
MRVGLIGWCCRTGLGNQNCDLFRTGRFDRWLIPRHPILGVDKSMLLPGDNVSFCDVKYAGEQVEGFLPGLDALTFVERPYLSASASLLSRCLRLGIKTCCVPNMEWLPKPTDEGQEWVRLVDAMFAPTRWTLRKLQEMAARYGDRLAWSRKIVGGRWGVDLGQFSYENRPVCRRFVFANGWGGVQGRKGAEAVYHAASRVPEAIVKFFSQTGRVPPLYHKPPNVQLMIVNFDYRSCLYQSEAGDVLLAPSKWEGLGLPLYEAQACGMPVITTDGEPMNEAGPEALLIRAKPAAFEVDGHHVNAYDVDAEHLAELMRGLLGQPIGERSHAAAWHVEQHHNLADVAEELLAALR